MSDVVLNLHAVFVSLPFSELLLQCTPSINYNHYFTNFHKDLKFK
jgi:hypothetical protein